MTHDNIIKCRDDTHLSSRHFLWTYNESVKDIFGWKHLNLFSCFHFNMFPSFFKDYSNCLTHQWLLKLPLSEVPRILCYVSCLLLVQYCSNFQFSNWIPVYSSYGYCQNKYKYASWICFTRALSFLHQILIVSSLVLNNRSWDVYQVYQSPEGICSKIKKIFIIINLIINTSYLI